MSPVDAAGTWKMEPKVIHYGLWDDERGWWYHNCQVWTTTSEVVAKAQCDHVHRDQLTLKFVAYSNWRVRQLEEWARNTPIIGDEGATGENIDASTTNA